MVGWNENKNDNKDINCDYASPRMGRKKKERLEFMLLWMKDDSVLNFCVVLFIFLRAEWKL